MIKEIRSILQSGLCLSDFSDKCKNDGNCIKCENEALKKLIAGHDEKIRAEEREKVIDILVERFIFPLLDEYDIGVWKHIDYIELADEWVEAVKNNYYSRAKNHDKAIKEELKKWLFEQLKGAE